MKKNLIKISILLVIFISLITYSVSAIIENGLVQDESINIRDQIGTVAGDNEKTYEHIGRYIRRDDEANDTRYITQEQYDSVKQYLSAAYSCSGGKYWWTCSNHAYAWTKLKEFGVFSQADYEAYTGKQNDFQSKYLGYDYTNGYYLKNMITDIWQLEVNSQCTISTLVSYLNNITSNAEGVLSGFSSVFCIKHNQPVPSWYDYFGLEYTFTVNDYVTATHDVTSRSITSNDKTTVNDNGIYDYKDASEPTTKTTKSHIKYFVTNKNNEDLHTINNGFGTYTTNVFIYGLSFSQKLHPSPGYLSGNYGQERAQRSIWGVVGASETSYRNDTLYKAGKAVDDFESQLASHGENPKVQKVTGYPSTVTSGEHVGEYLYEPTGTTIYINSSGEEIYRIGPFYMNDYAYAANAEVPLYSGSGVSVDNDLVGGIIYGEIVLSNGTAIPIGYNERVDGTTFQRTNGVGNAKIVYEDALKRPTPMGECNRSGSYFYAPNGYQYPWPKSTFYIDVPRSECGGATSLSSIAFEYRKTYTEGTGWVITGKYARTDWEVKDITTGCTTYYASCPRGWTYSASVSSYTQCPVTVSWSAHTHYYNHGCACTGSCGTDKDGNPTSCGHCCDGHECAAGSKTGKCSHGHTKCQYFNWKSTSCKMSLAQPFLAVHDATTYVDIYDKSYNLGVRLTTNVTIDKYITKVEHTNENEVAVITDNYTAYDDRFDSEFSNDDRANKSDTHKYNNSVKLERGDRVTYKLRIKNSSGIAVQVQIKDVLPSYCIVEDVSVGMVSDYEYTAGDGKKNDNNYFITNWLEVPANDSSYVSVTLLATASDATIENKNTATIVSSNRGRDVDGGLNSGVDRDDDHINYVRLVSGKGAVVNTAQIGGGAIDNVLKSSEYYTVKSYNVVVDKYIAEVRHMTTQEITYQRDKLSFEKDKGINGYTKSQAFNDRDVYNDNTVANSSRKSGYINQNKYNNSVYVEYGDKVTYNIDLQNTWYANAKENNQQATGASNAGVNSNPYYAPNYIHIDITDVLPECYEEGSLEVKYYIYDVQHGNDSNGDNHIAKTLSYSPGVSKKSNGTYTFSIDDLYINPNAESMLEVSFIVDTNQTGVKYENNVCLDKSTGLAAGKGGSGYGNTLSYEIRNINNYYVYNTTNNGNAPIRVWAADYFMLNDYNAKIDKYISFYDESVLTFNNGMDFEAYYGTDLSNRPNQSDTYKFENPVSAEKTEIVKYTIKVFNEAVDEVIESSPGFDYYKPATEVRVSSLTDNLEDGLTLIHRDQVKAMIYNSNGEAEFKDPITVTVDPLSEQSFNFNIPNKWEGKYTMVEPGGYIEYTTEVRIDRSNMHLYNLENEVLINVLTDINNLESPMIEKAKEEKDKHTRVVTERNIATQQSSRDYIRLKDLIISGKVWLDYDKDGYMKQYNGLSSVKAGDTSNINEERVMEGIVVKLYEDVNKDKNDANDVVVRTTVTDKNGLYTFARINNSSSTYRTGMDQRIDKARTKDKNGNYPDGSQYIDYYVEFEYDGVLYKSTEIYSGKKNLEEDGLTMAKYDRDSNAKEFIKEREEFNKKYQYITYDAAYATGSNVNSIDLANKTPLRFDKQGHKSYLIINHERMLTSRSFIIEESTEEIRSACTIAINSCTAGKWKNCKNHWDEWEVAINAGLIDPDDYANNSTGRNQAKDALRNILNSLDNRPTTQMTEYLWLFNYPFVAEGTEVGNILKPETEYLKYINLGLEEREEIDISLTKDVYEVKTTINGEEMEYTFNQNDGVNGRVGTGEGFLKDFEVAHPYGLTLYESDYKYRFGKYKNEAVRNYKGEESELNVEVTYRIRVDNVSHEKDLLRHFGGKNNSVDVQLDARIHEIVDLYDMNFKKYNDNPNETVKFKEKYGDNNELLRTNDKDMKIAEAWYNTSDGKKVSLTLSNSSIDKNLGKNNDFTADGYNTLYISGMDGVTIPEGGHLDIFVKYVVDKEKEAKDGQEANALKIAENITSKTNSKGQENIAQINLYSVWYEDGKPTSMLDMDSNSGNIGEKNSSKDRVSADDSNYYEDNVYKTGVDITAPNSPNEPADPVDPIRTISGIVWDDARSDSKTVDGYTQYLGNGIYTGNDLKDKANSKAKQNESVKANNYKHAKGEKGEENDLLVSGAKVEYVEIINVNGKYYEEKLDNMPWNPVQNIRTDENGTYKLKGFIPGYYVVRYSYGDDVSRNDMLIFNGQDYKSTKYTGVADWTDTDVKDEDARLYGMQAKNKSDARDDEIRRLETIAYSETMVNKKAEVLKGVAKGKVESIKNQPANTNAQLKELIDNASMHADTVRFYVKPEKLGALTVPENTTVKKYNNLEGTIIYKDLDNLKFGDTTNKAREYEIQNIDFGIEYRPETQISLSKEISRVKLITSDGEELVNLALRTLEFGKGEAQEHEIITEESTGLEYTQFVSNDYKTINPSLLTSEDYQGFIFVNIETDVLQGCSIVIEYKFTAENNSEVDLINQNLDNLRYRQNSQAQAHSKYFAFIKTDGDGTIYRYNANTGRYSKEKTGEDVGPITNAVYSAAATARNKLYDEYYDRDEHGSVYRTKIFKSYDKNKTDNAQINDIYYGRYMSKLYYVGEVGTNDKVSSIKFDKILDYVDTDLVFNEKGSERQTDKLWSTATDDDLKSLYVKETSYTPIESLANKLRLVNPDKVTYVSYKDDVPVASNLVVSVDDRTSDSDANTVNTGMSKFLMPYLEAKADDSRGTIFLEVSKVIASETESDDMQFENFAEVIQFTTQTGRRTNYATTIGNANASLGEFEESTKEPDTSATEVVTLIPPTGLMGPQKVIAEIMDTAKAGVEVMSMTGLVAAIIGVVVILVLFVIRKYRKRRIK